MLIEVGDVEFCSVGDRARVGRKLLEKEVE